MTTPHTTPELPEALRLANYLEKEWVTGDCLNAARELRRLHAENSALAEIQWVMAPPQEEAREEQSVFEEWLRDTCPSGDVESVQRQWEESYEYRDFHAAPQPPASALPLAVGVSLDPEMAQILQDNASELYSRTEAAPPATGNVGAVGTLHIQHYLNAPEMENREYVPIVDLPPGSHPLYANMQGAIVAQREVCAAICDQIADQYARQARGGDNSGASDHREAAARECAADIRESAKNPKSQAISTTCGDSP